MDGDGNCWVSKRTSYILFVVFTMAFCGHWLLEKNGVHIPLIHAYMDDLICIPVILFPFLMIYRLYIHRSQHYIFPAGYIILLWIMLSVVFELYLPYRNSEHVADPIDMVLYAIGGCIFWFMQQPFGKIHSAKV